MGATPPEEIAQQHEEACVMIQNQTQCAPRVNHGEVPLQWKLRPTASIILASESATNSGCGGGSRTNPNAPDEGANNDSDDVPSWCISSRKFLL